MAFDFGTSSSPSTPATGAAKAAPAVTFDFGQSETAATAPATGASGMTVYCPNCGGVWSKTYVPPNLESHAPRPPEYTCAKCGYRSPY